MTKSYHIRPSIAAAMAIMLTLSQAPWGFADEASAHTSMSREQIDAYWHQGKTLPLEIGKQYPPGKLNIPNDKGYNIMIDISHQCSFASLWGLAGRLIQQGYRPVTNQASLNSVLDKNGKCRIRVPVDPSQGIRPFAWYPNFPVNILITEQSDPNGQCYTEAEQKALLEFVEQGGTLVIQGVPINNADAMKNWSLNTLARQFGGELTAESDRYEGKHYAALQLDDNWKVTAKGKDGKAVEARRSFGKGKVVLHGSLDAIRKNGKDEEAGKKADQNLGELLDWASAGQTPLTEEARLPQPMGGGGAIYPELENSETEIIVYYAQNQKPELLKTVTESYPLVTQKVQNWLPSPPTKEPMYLILSAGDGGGWAVNAFKPKENGIISASPLGLISIYAHELAHTMGGPANAQGDKAAASPMPNQGEAHAGWFQGKADALFDEPRRTQANRSCNVAFENPKLLEFDLKKYSNDQEYRKQYNNSDEWTKTWYIWQKLDDRYGTTWYPRWRWIQHTRWANDPGRKLTWEEMVEDMSIACGEDLFPFFHKINIKLDRDTAGELEFMGKKYNLSPAPLEASPAGPVRLEEIGDYKQPIKPRA